ncbi:MAG TPA: 4-alpha-glucanotransferase [Ramlibacter sp.]|nr:4-alpha-glucanotransferase [Ramlibacter sp.]
MKRAAASPLDQRSSGVLLHPTSLPGPHGSGDLGPAAYHFVDWLASARQSLWQVLPLNPPGPGHSPYQTVSTFAGSPWLIDLSALASRGWLTLDAAPSFDAQRCDHASAHAWRMAMLRWAWHGFQGSATPAERASFAAFNEQHARWLDDYALFMALEQRHGEPWTRWPTQFAQRDPAALGRLREDTADDLGFWRFVQWVFMGQWQRLRRHAHDRGVRIVGDAPIFVAHHSAEVWANASQYLLDTQGEPSVVAGVPPDYFSETGQRWGNPLYDWDAMQRDGFAWWRDRVAHLFTCFDVVRIDHFRGFEAYWEVPAHEELAVNGRWRPGPGRAIFDALREALGKLPLIAEDLGLITPEVTALRKACGLPGMRVLQFAFGDTAKNPYLPHNYVPETVVYTGTHDNDTTVGWWLSRGAGERDAALAYLGPQAQGEIHWAMIRAASQSVARTAIYPFQDVLGLDGEHRMNIPGNGQACWEWRFDWPQVGDAPGAQLASITQAHGRCD